MGLALRGANGVFCVILTHEAIHERANEQACPRVSPWATHRGSYLKYAYRELSTGTLIGISGLGSIVWVLLLALAGPGTIGDVLDPLQRLAYFVSVGGLSWPASHALAAILLYLVRLRSRSVVVVTAVAGGLYAAANIGAVAYALVAMFAPGYPRELSITTIYLLSAVVAVPHFGLLYFLAWQRAKLRPLGAVAGTAANAIPAASPAAEQDKDSELPASSTAEQEGTHPVSGSVESPPGRSVPAGPAEPHARFLSRLPAKLGRDLVYVTVNGHYLKVVTAAGTGALLMRLSDAVQELGETGVRVHRSHWVAHRHITGVVQRDEQTLISVTGGDQVPVSRTYRAAVRKAVAP